MKNFLDPLDFDIYKTVLIRKREFYNSILTPIFEQEYEALNSTTAFLKLQIPLSNDEIIAGVKAMDNNTFSQIHRSSYQEVKRMILKENGSVQDVDDIFQNTIIKLIEDVNGGDFKLNKSIEAYMVYEAKNIWKNQRSTNRNRRIILDREQYWIWDRMEPVEYPEKFEIIRNCIDRLNDSCKKLIETHYYSDQDWSSIAESFGYANADSAKNQNYKCKEKLKKDINARIERMKKESNIPTFLTVNQACRYLKVSGQTIHNLKNSGNIGFQTVGGRIRFSHKDLNNYLVLNNTNFAWCNESIVWLDIKKQIVILFEKDNLYRIVNENQKWIYLFSNRWDNIGQFSINEFKKYFSIADEIQIDSAKFSLGSEIL